LEGNAGGGRDTDQIRFRSQSDIVEV
jgi:hypothetical protein